MDISLHVHRPSPNIVYQFVTNFTPAVRSLQSFINLSRYPTGFNIAERTFGHYCKETVLRERIKINSRYKAQLFIIMAIKR